MSNINKQALRGQSVDANFYLAECCNCGQVMPSSKLIESRNYMDGDADCYCPHCNADDCDISDMGSAASEAWNYQQKRIDELLNELEAAEKRIAELESERDKQGRHACELFDEAKAQRQRTAELEVSHSKLRESMAAIHNTIRLDGVRTSLSAIMGAAKRAHDESAAAAGIKGE